MTALLHDLRAALTGAELAPLARWYGAGVRFDCLTAHRAAVTGPAAAAAVWPRAVEGPGEVTGWSAECASGGWEVDVQRRLDGPGGPRAVRQLHWLHVEDGTVVRHVVLGGRPRAAVPLPGGVVGRLVGAPVVELAHGGFSSSALYRARLPDGEPAVVKHLRPQHDWMARATGDGGREGLLHTQGVYGALPPRLRSPVVAAEPCADGWVVVMRDVTPALEALGTRPARERHERLLQALHALHTAFTGRPASMALCSVRDRLRLFTPVRWLLERPGADLLPKTFLSTWEAFADVADADVAGAVLRLLDDPSPLLAALEGSAAPTLLHGDYRPGNVGLDGGAGAVALDWGLACHGPPELDFVWYLSNSAWDGDDERDWLERAWERLTGTPRHGPAADLAVVFHAVMGEVGFLCNALVHPPRGFARPSPQTGRWWLARVRAAFERLGDLA